MANKNAEKPMFIAGMGESPEDTENGANMAEQYREAGEQAEKENEETLKQRGEDAKSRPVVALGTGEAIAMGVRAGDSPTEGKRAEGWEFVSEDVTKVAKVAGDIAEVGAESNEKVEEARREATRVQGEAIKEAGLGAFDGGPTIAHEADPTTTQKADGQDSQTKGPSLRKTGK